MAVVIKKDIKIFRSCVDMWSVENKASGYIILTKDIDRIDNKDIILHTEVLKDKIDCELPRLDDTKPLAVVSFFSKCITKSINRTLLIRCGKLSCRNGVPSMSRVVIDDYYNDYLDICKLDNDKISVISSSITKSLDEDGIKNSIRSMFEMNKEKTKLVYYKEIKVVKANFDIKNSLLDAGITHRFTDLESLGLTEEDMDSEIVIVGTKRDFILDLYKDNKTPVIRRQNLSNLFDIRNIEE